MQITSSVPYFALSGRNGLKINLKSFAKLAIGMRKWIGPIVTTWSISFVWRLLKIHRPKRFRGKFSIHRCLKCANGVSIQKLYTLFWTLHGLPTKCCCWWTLSLGGGVLYSVRHLFKENVFWNDLFTHGEKTVDCVHVGYCIVFVHLYSASLSMSISEAIVVRPRPALHNCLALSEHIFIRINSNLFMRKYC